MYTDGKVVTNKNHNYMQYLVEYRIGKYGNLQHHLTYNKQDAIAFAKKVRELTSETIYISEVRVNLELTEEVMK